MDTPIAQWPVIWPSSRLVIDAAIIDLAAAMGRTLRKAEISHYKMFRQGCRRNYSMSSGAPRQHTLQ